MVARTILYAAVLLSLAAPAHALCRDELADIKPRIDRLKGSSPQRYYLALKWYGRAVEAESGSEVECLNFLAMTRKALSQPLTDVADCLGPNAYLPNCQDGNGQTGQGPGPVGPVVPIVGGAGNGAAPPPPFHPPGSPGGGPGIQATGTDR